ncbi:reverse transcriptase [Plakobranchus ocellatus]|uniref:Reverse transcriptase n=1 Tax=Plakobranchus ocellatus TaxID=259542 RepID=A0AAV4AH25_9GAST|nr:reverse transcriptase [Plakobranchus ocellatus]
MTAEGVYIPKEQDSRGINQFRPISLLNVEGKIFFSVMASRLTKYLKAFMDDTTIICSKEDETRRMLRRVDDLMSWAFNWPKWLGTGFETRCTRVRILGKQPRRIKIGSREASGSHDLDVAPGPLRVSGVTGPKHLL